MHLIHHCRSSVCPACLQVVTFRNNLNKITQTPLSCKPGDKPGDAWIIDACAHSGTLYLDIVPMPERSFANADLFTYYGEWAVLDGDAIILLGVACPHGMVGGLAVHQPKVEAAKTQLH